MIQDNSMYIYIYIYVQSINTTNHIRTKTTTCFGLITLYLLYSLLTSPVQPDDEPVIRPKHVVVFVLI